MNRPHEHVRPLTQVIIKAADSCNLNCTYCHIYNKADQTADRSPRIMSDAVFEATLERIRRHCELATQDRVKLIFHGGEPCQAGHDRIDRWCQQATETLSPQVRVVFSLQTNGTLLNAEWGEVLRRHAVGVGVSLDGPAVLNDRARVDHRGRGSHAAVLRGIDHLRSAGLGFSILSVVQFGVDPVETHRHLVSLGPREISYLLPAETHETVADLTRSYGPTPCADFLVSVFDEWWFNGTIDLRVREFWSIAQMILGGRSLTDAFGAGPVPFVTIETDGSIHGTDKLRACEDGMSNTGLNVVNDDFIDVLGGRSVVAEAMKGIGPPQACAGCDELLTCGGGHLANRYSRARGFDNRSVWCQDILMIFRHIRSRLGIDPAETARRRARLAGLTRIGSSASQVPPSPQQ